MGDLLERIALPVSKIIARINAPRIAHAVMMHALDTVHHRVAHVHIGMRHINLGAQHLLAIGKLTCAHAFKQIHTLFDRALPIRARAPGFGNRTAIRTHLFKRELLDIRMTCFNQLNSPVKELLKIITGKANLRPLKPEPCDICFNRTHKLVTFLLWVGVVKTQVALPTKFFGDTKIQANRFGMANL